MKMTRYMMTGAMIGYAMGCRMESLRKHTAKAFKRAKRMLRGKLGL